MIPYSEGDFNTLGFDEFPISSLNEMEAAANTVGLTTTAFHYVTEDGNDYQFVNAHHQDQSPLPASIYEVRATDPEGFYYELERWQGS